MGAPIGPWPAGIDMVSEPTALQKDACRDALNGYFSDGGHFISRWDELLLQSGALHSPWTATDGTAYVMDADVLCTIDASGTLVSLGTLATPESVWFDELNGEVVVGSMTALYRITASGIQLIGVPEPGAFSVAPHAAGGLDAGRYACAISYVSPTGEEGPLSPVSFVDVPDGGGIRYTLPTPIEPTSFIRLYRSPPSGEVLYLASTAPVIAQYLIGTGNLTKQATTQYKTRMMPGKYVKLWQGRMLVARGRVLYFSDALTYGLCSERFSFVQMQNEIVFIETFPSGVFVGTTRGTYFLDGASPDKWVIRLVDVSAPLGDASLRVPAESLPSTMAPSGVDYVAVWLGAGGFHFGLPSGAVLRPQADRIELDLFGQRGSLQVVDGVLTAVIY